MNRPARSPSPTPPLHAEIVIIGGGPAGVEALLAARDRGFDAVLVEGGSIGASIRKWQHVRLFSPWRFNRSERGIAALMAAGFPLPNASEIPTGREFVEQYLEPIVRSERLAPSVFEHIRVVSAARKDTLKGDLIGDARRGDAPFRVLWERVDDGSQRPREGVIECRYLIDASGVYEHPNWCGTGGGPAPGERNAAAWTTRQIPDPLGADRTRFRGKKTVVVGGGYSAATCIRDLTALARETNHTFVHWSLRNPDGNLPFVQDDPLPERRRLSEEVNALANDPPPFLRIWPGTVVDAFGQGEVVLRDTRTGVADRLFVDEVVSLTGFHPDRELLAELQVHHCYATDGLMKLSASLLSQDAGGDCLALESGSSETLRNPEPGLFVIGSKSYGRFSQYLLRSGVEQVDAIFGELLPAALVRNATDESA